MLGSTLATLAALAALTLAAPAAIEQSAALTTRGDYYEPTIHKVTVGKPL